MEKRLLYVVYTFKDRTDSGIGSILLEHTKAPKNWEEIQSLVAEIEKFPLKEVVLINWFYLDSKF